MRDENNTCENTVLPKKDLPAWDLRVVGPGGAGSSEYRSYILGGFPPAGGVQLIFLCLKKAAMKICVHILLITLWRYNLHTIKFTHLTCTIKGT